MEVAGVVLGAVALVRPVHDLYRNCAALFINTRNYTKELKKCGENFAIQQRLFLQTFQLIVQTLVEEDVVAAMLGDKDHPQWKDPSFQAEWENTIGDCFDTPLKVTRETLGTIESRLSKLHARVTANQNSASVPPSKLSKTERVKAAAWRVDWGLSGREELHELIKTLRTQNNDLGALQRQRHSLRKSGPRFRELHSKPPDPKVISAQLLAIREVAKRVYDGLAVTARCSCHRVNLQLQGQPDGPGSKSGTSSTNKGLKSASEPVSAIRFHFIVTKDPQGRNLSLDSETHCECTCITINSELQLFGLESASANGKRPGMADIEPKKKRVRFAAEGDEADIETSSERAIITISDDRQPTGKRVMSIDLGAGNKRVKFEFSGDSSNPPTMIYTTIATESNPIAQAAAAKAPIPATPVSVKEIDNLCLLLANLQSRKQTKELLGRIPNKDCNPTYRHLMYHDPPIPSPTSRTSLETILTRVDKQYLLPRLERLNIALILSLSLLHYGSYSTSWFQERWRSRDIFFFLEAQGQFPGGSRSTLNPYVVPFSPTSIENASSTGGIPTTPSKGIARNEQLFSLALVLIEIAFGKTLFSIYEPRNIPQKDGDDIAEYMKAKMILSSGMLAKEMGSVYAEVVRRCLYCDFGIVEEDLGKRELQEIFYEKVVCELERCLKKFQEM